MAAPRAHIMHARAGRGRGWIEKRRASRDGCCRCSGAGEFIRADGAAQQRQNETGWKGAPFGAAVAPSGARVALTSRLVIPGVG